MKKHNFIFGIECVIIVVFLAVIGILIKDEKREVHGRETISTVIEVEQEESVATAEMTEAETADAEPVAAAEDETEESEQAITEEKSEAEAAEEDAGEEDSDAAKEKKDDKVKIVVFGDSIWGDGRGEDGISEQVMEQFDVEIYNCAIGGTAAALEKSQTLDNWDSKSFNGMVYVARDKISANDLIANDAACEVIKNVDFEEIDYVIVSYGLNDYFSDIPIYPQEYYDLTSYVGALRHGIHKLRKDYPQLEFIITSPTYCGWFVGQRQFELDEYVEAARSVAEEMDAHFLDMYHAFSKDVDKKIQYLEDGVHLTEEGRWLYSRSVIDCLESLGIQNTKNQE